MRRPRSRQQLLSNSTCSVLGYGLWFLCSGKGGMVREVIKKAGNIDVSFVQFSFGSKSYCSHLVARNRELPVYVSFL